MYRHNPQTHRLVELVGSGAIGELRVIRAAFSYALYDVDNIRLRTDVEGGSLMDVGCYCVSGSRLLGGEPESVYGQAYIGPSGTDWTFAGMMRFPGDVVALFDCGTALAERDELEAIGTRGLALPRRSLALPRARDRASPERQRGADRARARGFLPARAREPVGRDSRRGDRSCWARRCGRPGAGDRRSVPIGGVGQTRRRARQLARLGPCRREAREYDPPMPPADSASPMPSSLEIAQAAKLEPIAEIADEIGLLPEEVELYGSYKAKVDLAVLDRLAGKPDAKLVCVTAITPTKAGEGKTTTSVSLTQGLGKIGKTAGALPPRGVARPGVRDQGRCGGRRLRAGRADGGSEPPLHGRHPRDRRR